MQGLLIFLTLVVKKSALKDMWRQSKSSMARLRLLKTTEDSEMTQVVKFGVCGLNTDVSSRPPTCLVPQLQALKQGVYGSD